MIFITACAPEGTPVSATVTDLGSYVAKTALNTSYDFNDSSINESCTTGSNPSANTYCAAVIFWGTSKVGIAVKNGHVGGNGDFEFRIYFDGTKSTIATDGSTITPDCEVMIRKGSIIDRGSQSGVSMQIDCSAVTTCTITFLTTISVDSLALDVVNTDTITAKSY